MAALDDNIMDALLLQIGRAPKTRVRTAGGGVDAYFTSRVGQHRFVMLGVDEGEAALLFSDRRLGIVDAEELVDLRISTMMLRRIKEFLDPRELPE